MSIDRGGKADAPQRRVEVEKAVGLYVHVPFCSSKCPYCDFNSVAVTGASALPFEESRFINSLCIELDTVLEALESSSFTPSTLYFGGGTPSLLSPQSITRFIEFVRDKGGKVPPAEITVEVNPESATPEKLGGYRSAGVNRISIGMQSFNADELKLLGRPHTVAEGVAAFMAARAAGFDNIGIDLIFGLPGRTLKSWQESLARVVELAPEHISLYGLTIEPGTPFHDRYSGGLISDGGESVRTQSASLTSLEEEGQGGAPTGASVAKGGTLPPPEGLFPIDDGLYIELYTTAIESLTKAGYEHYEVSNFALQGRRSRHNCGYWNGAEYIGLGPGAHSFFLDSEWGRRSWNVKGVQKYLNIIESAGQAVEGAEVLDKESAMLEFAMLGLRLLKSGIAAKSFGQRFGEGSFERFVANGRAQRLIERGLLYKRGEDLLLTGKGLQLADTVIAEL